MNRAAADLPAHLSAIAQADWAQTPPFTRDRKPRGPHHRLALL
jgi:phage terminase small subunit